jgi:putative chitinase
MIDRDRFFAEARRAAFGGSMTQGQVDGCNAILDAWESRGDMTDRRWIAYMLATAKWETDRTMQPVEEAYYLGSRADGYRRTLRYFPYYGRGYVQLTWESNYRKLGALLGVDLLGHPELALDPKIAALVMFEGMKGGLFTGVGLPRYFNANIDAPVAARQIINGLDHAYDVAAIHRAFLEALS